MLCLPFTHIHTSTVSKLCSCYLSSSFFFYPDRLLLPKKISRLRHQRIFPGKYSPLSRCLVSYIYIEHLSADDYSCHLQMLLDLFCSHASNKRLTQPSLCPRVHMEIPRPRGTNIKLLKSVKRTCRSILNTVCFCLWRLIYCFPP